MQVVSVGVATLVALILLYSGTNSSTAVPDTAIIKAEAPKSVTHHTQYEYIPVQQVEVVPTSTRLEQKAVEPVVVTAPVITPVPEVPQETAVSVCLGKFVGALCSFDSREGTCLTLAQSPLTCVLH
jgi:hypothetical protein